MPPATALRSHRSATENIGGPAVRGARPCHDALPKRQGRRLRQPFAVLLPELEGGHVQPRCQPAWPSRPGAAAWLLPAVWPAERGAPATRYHGGAGQCAASSRAEGEVDQALLHTLGMYRDPVTMGPKLPAFTKSEDCT